MKRRGMKLSPVIARMRRAYERHGILKSLGLAFRKIWQAVFGVDEIVYYLENRMVDSQLFNFPDQFRVDRYERSRDIPSDVRESMYEHRGGMALVEPVFNRLFHYGAHLWVAMLDNSMVGSIWTIRGGIRRKLEIPIPQEDVFLIASEIYPEFRGKRLNVFMMNWIIRDLVRRGERRFYIASEAGNTAQISSLSRSMFKPFCRVRRLELLGRRVTIWSPFPVQRILKQVKKRGRAAGEIAGKPREIASPDPLDMIRLTSEPSAGNLY